MRFAVHYRDQLPVHLALGALALLIWAVDFSFLLRDAEHPSTTLGVVLVWFMALLAMAGLAKAAGLARSTSPAVRLGQDGLVDRRWSRQPISWFNIAEFDPLRRFGVRVVRLRLKNPEADPPETLLARLARGTGLVPADAVLVLVPGLDCTADELAQRILEIGTAAIETAQEAEEWARASPYAAPPNG
jgi:hypothetical protein